MRILSIHNRYQIRGGEDESRELEERLLRDHGHHVDVYEEHNNRVSSLKMTQVAVKTIWSQEAYKKVRQQLQQVPTNLIHVQNFFPLISPSVYYAAQHEGVPVVQTLRNYRLLCPNGLFFREGKVCEDCLDKLIPYPGVIHRCYRKNFAASSVTAGMLTVHRMLRTWIKQVNMFIAISQFARNKFIEAGFPPDKILVKPNFVHPDPGLGEGRENYALFVGRLSTEKGLDTLLSAWQMLKTPITLKIVGDGPLAPEVINATNTMPNVEWLGRKPMKEVYQLMGDAMMLIFPSKWYETFGRVAVEAFAKGTPVIAANIGAIAELVEDQRTGLHFSPGNSKDLADKVEWFLTHPTERQTMRQEARQAFLAKYTAEQNYQMLQSIYQKLT